PRLSAGERQAQLDGMGLPPPLEPALGALSAPLQAIRAGHGPVDPERWLAVVMTSGTTRQPRGVALSRRAVVASAEASARNLGWLEDDRWLLGLPVAHVGGLSILTRCLLARRTAVVPSEVAAGARLETEGLVRCIEQDTVTLVSLVPTQLEW